MERYIKYATSGGSIAKYSLTKHCKTGECIVSNAEVIEKVNELKSVILYDNKRLSIKYDNVKLYIELDLDILSKGENIEKFNKELLKFLENGGLFDLAHYQKEPIPMVD